MGKRRKAREAALQILFQTEFNDNALEDILNQFWKNQKADRETRAFSRVLVENVVKHRDEVDQAIEAASEHWRVSRMSAIDLSLLRLAVSELFYTRETAPAIVINEAIEIAKKFSDTKATNFINGILDAIKRTIEKENGLPEGEKNDG